MNFLLSQLRHNGIDGLVNTIKERRRTGKSTGQALRIIGEAMKSPGNSIVIKDYDTNYEMNKSQTKQIMIPLIEQLIRKMELKGFDVNMTDMTLTYDYTAAWE